MAVEINNISKKFGELRVFENFSMSIKENKITSILGPSGCGKTTLLNILANLLQPEKGHVSKINRDRVSYLFQEPRLLPWKTVFENIDIVLRNKIDASERKETVNKIIESVALSKFAGYYPPELSGGMKQRVSMARAFVYPSDVLLMDEPFKGLDIKLKLNIIKTFLSLWKKDRRTTIFVTHDTREAMLLGDEIVVLSSLPSQIIKSFPNPIRPEKRSIDNKALIDIETGIYQILLS